MDKTRGKESRELIGAVRRYCRMGLNGKKHTGFERVDIIKGYYKNDQWRAKRLLAVYILLLLLKVEEKEEEYKILLFVSENMGKPNMRKSLTFWIVRYARLNFFDERTVYRRWSYILASYRRIIERM